MKWIATQEALDQAIARMKSSRVIAIDTEADSLHSYFDKVCLIQISFADENLLIDPLAKIDLAGLGPVLADPDVNKIFHGADYDLRILHRDFGFEVRNLMDTMVSAQMLGYEGVGLGAVLKRHFNLEIDKSYQRADWAKRPLPPTLLEYAATDTRHLIELARILRTELEQLGRWSWAREEFQRLEVIRFVQQEPDEESWRKIKGSGRLERRSLAAVARLHAWRDRNAQALDRPPFKVLGNDVLLEVATRLPRTGDDLKGIKGVSGWHLRNWGRELLQIVTDTIALPPEALPEKKASKTWLRDKELERRIEALKKIRDNVATDLKIDPSLVAPKHVLASIAALDSPAPAALDSIPAMREWQKALVGPAFLAALSPKPKP